MKQVPVIGYSTRKIEKGNTKVVIPWPVSACSQLDAIQARFLQFVWGFAALNPHAAISLTWNGKQLIDTRKRAGWSKWWPNNPTPPIWYDRESFERLLAREAHSNGERTVRDFITDFRGLSGSAKGSIILAANNMTRTKVSDLFKNGKPTPAIPKLLKSMQAHASSVKAADLGILGKDHLASTFGSLGVRSESFQYKRVLTTDENGLPVVIEVAFGYAPASNQRRLLTGVNFSPAIANPFRRLNVEGEGLERLLSAQMCEPFDPVVIAIHLTCPKIKWLGLGKDGISLHSDHDEVEAEEFEIDPKHYAANVETEGFTVASELIDAVKAVTKKWVKQKRSEIRDSKARANRLVAMTGTAGKPKMKAILEEIIESAYLKVSRNPKNPSKRLPVNARQLMYHCRHELQSRSGRKLINGGSYFTQTLLPNYINEFKPAWGDQVMYDARGQLREPHTGLSIPLGTAAVRAHLSKIRQPQSTESYDVQISTVGPQGRYAGLLFIEKEGFDALIAETQIAERYDLATMSTKGLSVTAARHMAEELCSLCKIPLFVLTDFDKAGFSGISMFMNSNRRHTYSKAFEVYHIGLRLADIEALGIEDRAEDSFDKGSPEAIRANLEANGAMPDEIEFLMSPLPDDDQSVDVQDDDDEDDDNQTSSRNKKKRTGKRVELNALSPAELVDLIERKLQEYGIKKVVPKKSDLAEAYQVFKRGVMIREMVADVIANAKPAKVPADLAQQVRTLLNDDPTIPWDAAVARVAGYEVE